MTNNTPDYNDNLYFEKKMDCKNCPCTDEYFASGDCERNAGVSKTLTEQWKKGELPDGYHYAIVFDKERIIEKKKDLPIPYCEGFCCQNYQYLAPVPSYDACMAFIRAIDNVTDDNAQLKDLLKECKDVMNMAGYVFAKVKDVEKARKLLQQIDEVLK